MKIISFNHKSKFTFPQNISVRSATGVYDTLHDQSPPNNARPSSAQLKLLESFPSILNLPTSSTHRPHWCLLGTPRISPIPLLHDSPLNN